MKTLNKFLLGATAKSNTLHSLGSKEALVDNNGNWNNYARESVITTMPQIHIQYVIMTIKFSIIHNKIWNIKNPFMKYD